MMGFYLYGLILFLFLYGLLYFSVRTGSKIIYFYVVGVEGVYWYRMKYKVLKGCDLIFFYLDRLLLMFFYGLLYYSVRTGSKIAAILYPFIRQLPPSLNLVAPGWYIRGARTLI